MTSRFIKSIEQVIPSTEELVGIVGRMHLDSIEDLSNSATLFSGNLDGREVLVSFDFFEGCGILTDLGEPENPAAGSEAPES